MTRHLRLTACLLAGLAVAAPAAAWAQEGGESRGGRLDRLEGELDAAARSAAERLAQALNMALGSMTIFVDSLPAYEKPEILPNGDILIRRIPKAAEGAPGPARPSPGAEGSDEAVEL